MGKSTGGGRSSEDLTRSDLVQALEEEHRSESAWMLFYHQAMADRLGLNDTDQKCLDIILKGPAALRTGPITPSQLARECRLTTGAVTGVLDRLERSGFVKREHDPEDRRRIIIRPTMDKVESEVAPCWAYIQEEFGRLCLDYTDEELRLLTAFSRRWQDILKEATTQLRSLAPAAESERDSALA